MRPEPIGAGIVAGAKSCRKPGIGLERQADGVRGRQRMAAELTAPEARALSPENTGGDFEALGDDAGQVGGRHRSAQELHLRAEVRALVEEDDGNLAVANRLHRLAKTVAAGNEAHAETLARGFDPDLGGGEVQRSVERDPVQATKVGVEHLHGRHHLHQGEVGDEENLTAGHAEAVGAIEDLGVELDARADFGFAQPGRSDRVEPHLGGPTAREAPDASHPSTIFVGKARRQVT